MESYGTSGACPKCGIYGVHVCKVTWDTVTGGRVPGCIRMCEKHGQYASRDLAGECPSCVALRLIEMRPVTRAEFDALVARVAALEGGK
jgi:hypothetical protein